MFKINVTDEFKESHKQYFNENIIPSLNNKIRFNTIDRKYILSEYKCNNIQDIHDEFIDYCIKNAERISIGDFNEIRTINYEINRDFPIIIKIINDKDFVMDEEKKKYWEVLVDRFGYNKFGECDLYDVIEEIAKKRTGIKKLTDIYNKAIVQEEIVRIIKELFPQISDLIDKKFNNINQTNIMYMKDFKKKFINFEKENSLSLTLENYKNIQNCDAWNSYLFVYASGLRTCPYCNRQYITPVLTSSGKLRATLDHFLPKNMFPFLSMSLYNLVPSCYNCNSSLKGKKEFDFNDISPYDESIDDYISFLANIEINNTIGVKVYHKTPQKYQEVDKYIDMFKLNEQYNYNVNQVEELIMKRYMYSEKYIKDIKERNKFNISQDRLKELIIGYSKDNMKINDEPLSKFRRDIVEQLGFFDDYDLYLENKLEEILTM